MKSNLFSSFYVLILVLMVYSVPTTAITSELRPCPSVGDSVCTQTMEGDSFSMTYTFGSQAFKEINNRTGLKLYNLNIRRDDKNAGLSGEYITLTDNLMEITPPISIYRSKPFKVSFEIPVLVKRIQKSYYCVGKKLIKCARPWQVQEWTTINKTNIQIEFWDNNKLLDNKFINSNEFKIYFKPSILYGKAPQIATRSIIGIEIISFTITLSGGVRHNIMVKGLRINETPHKPSKYYEDGELEGMAYIKHFMIHFFR